MGLVRTAHALRGRLRVEVLTDRPEERFALGATLYREGDDEPLTVTDGRPVADGPGWWLRFEGIDDRTSAEALVGAYLETAAVDASRLAPGEVWWHEVMGVPVTATDGRALGSVADVYRAGGAEVLIVRGGALGELDIPNVAAVVREFDPRGGRIVVDLEAFADPPGTAAPRPRGRRTRRALATGAAGTRAQPPGGAADGSP